MAKQINVDLRVNADIKQAKANFESLQKTLFKLQESTRIDVKDESLAKAQRAAGDLARNLQQATNVNTGKLDLNKFSSSLNKSGQDLKKLHQQLSSLGPEGEQAFFKLTQSIATADASTLNLGKKLSSLGVVLKNTARWQLSSSLLHGFMGAISGAYRYAQDLNESLNNIRIVTGQNIDQMSQFAKEANNAAKALSTTTTQYTDASLIYYQQGLSDEDVKRRTDATIKLANVSRQSAEEVSSQMTAIWNNFAKGNENLEYYEDVITKLGATTASSSSEIANGLSKFAAVADTVGLSYEKASAALATVVAETRQSEDIVGTAFKTMFARLEGLNLGETLEDGVDLNKYSKALEAVGVSILDNNGKIKSMNDIFDETGAKWQNIGKEQQIALAQTVAGVRQYTQFIALMDNYDKVLKNEAVAKGSAGTVDEQAKTYAESWEAARDRVTAALETIYQQLLRDDFFIDMLNGAEKFLGVISNVIDGLGGVKGILLLISSIFMQYYAKEMPRILQSLRDNISVITGTSERRAQALLAEAREDLELKTAMESRNRQMSAVATTAEVTAKMTEALNKARKGLSQTEIEAYEYEIKLAGAIGKTTEELGKEIDLLEKKGKATANQLIRQVNRDDNEKNRINRLSVNEQIEESYNYEQAKKDNEKRVKEKADIELHKTKTQDKMRQKQEELENNNLTDGQRKSRELNIAKNEKSIEKDNARLEEIEKENVLFEEMTKKYQKFIQYSKMSGKELFQEMEKLSKASGKRNLIIDEMGSKQQEWKDNFNKISKNGSSDFSSLIKEIEKYKQKLEEAGVSTKEIDNALKEIGKGNISGIDKIFNALNAAIDENNTDLELLQSQLKLLGVSDKDINELTKIWERAGAGSEEFKAKIEEIKNKIEELPQHTVKISEGLTQMASAATQVSMIINSFQNIGRIFSDEDLSVGEKIIQTMTAVGSMLPMIIALTNKQRIVEMGAVAAKILHIGATNADTAAETASIGAKIASGTAGWYALGPLLLFVVIAAAVVAAIVLITNALMAAANAESEEEKAVRLANEELERSKKAAEEAKKAYEDLKSAVSNYDSAVEALEKCTKGTQEWRDAFREVLNQASNLLTLYPDLLAEKNLFLSDGTLNSDILHQAEEKAKNISTNATNNQMLKQVSLTRANVNKGISNLVSTELNSKTKELSDLDLYRTSFFKENGDNVSAESLMKDLVTEIIAKNDFKDLTLNPALANENQSQIEALTKDFLEREGLIEDNLTDATSLFSQVLQDSVEDIQKLSYETENLATKMYNASNIIFKNYFKDKDFKDTNEEIAYQQAYDEMMSKYEDYYHQGVVAAHAGEMDENLTHEDAKNSGQMGSHDYYDNENWNRDAYEEIIKKYAAMKGLEIDEKNSLDWRDGQAYVRFKGQSKDDQLTIEKIAAEAVPALEAELADEISERGDEIYAEMDKKTTNALSYFKVKGNYNEVSYNEMKGTVLKEDGTAKTFDELFNGNEDQKKQYVANKLQKDVSEVTETDMASVQKYYEEQTAAAVATLNTIPDYLGDHLNKDMINNIDIGALDNVGKMYTKILAKSREEGLSVLDNIISQAGDEADEVLGALANMDLSTMNADQVNAALEELGIGFKLTESQIYSLKNSLTSSLEITAETAQETYKSISKVLSKLKSEGDTIEQADYDQLLALNPALESYFTMMADGTYMLTGQAKDFQKAVQTAEAAQMQQAIDNKEKTAVAYNTLADQSNATNDEITLAKIQVLYDNGETDVADEYMAAYNSGKSLAEINTQVAESYDKLNLSEDLFAEKSEKATEEAGKLTEALKETLYQNEISNAGLEYETTENYANVLMELYEAEGLSKEAARALSIANQRLDRGLSSLNDNFEKISESLKNTNKASAEYAETIASLRKSFADLLNIADGEELSTKWIEKWANDADKMKKILDGDTEAIQEFRESAFAEMTDNVFKEVNESAQKLFDGMTENDGKDIYNALQKLINQLDDGKISAEGLKQELDNIGSTEIGSKAVLSKEYTEALNTMLAQGLLTEQQLNDIFATIGYKPKVQVGSVDQTVEVPVYETTEEVVENDTMGPPAPGVSRAFTRTVRSTTKQIDTERMTQRVPVAQIESSDSATGNIEIVNAGSMNITPSYGSTTSGKSSDSSKKDSSSSSNPTTKAASHDHEVNRYSNEENAIKGLSEQYDRLNKAKDKAFGRSRIETIEAEIKKLKALKQASSNYLDAIVGNGNASKVAKALYNGEDVGKMIASGQVGGTARADYNSLFSGLSASGKGLEYTAKDEAGNEWLVSDSYSLSKFNSTFGTNLQFNLDSYGNIQNKDAIYNLLQNLTNTENDAYSKIANPTADSTTEYNKRMALLEEIKERIDQYGETADLLTEKTDEYLDYISSLQEKNAELITTKMEHGVNLGEKTLQKISRSLKILGDDIYRTAEGMSKWFNLTFEESVKANQQQADAYVEALKDAEQKINLYDQKDGQFNEDAIDPASAAEIFQSIEDGSDRLINDLLNDMEEGKEHFGKTLDYWNEKIERVNSAIEKNGDLLNHFQNILGLLGKNTDYQLMSKVIQGQLDNATSNYNTRKAEAQNAKEVYEKAQRGKEELIQLGVSDEALRVYEENTLQKALEDYQDKADKMYSALEKSIELSNQLFENEVNRIFAESEKRLAGKWGSFDALDSAMQRQQSVAEEYLTKTNQLYETNSMLRKLSQDIDKTDSSIAKAKLKAFSDEIAAMKTQEKLSKTDLEIAKARYEVLQAQIALEEAQNAKSTVRLQRDNEGNYGYVYTADQDKIADAEQKLEDKQNELYNLGLKKAEEYGQKIISIRKEWQAELKKIEEDFQNGIITSEEEYNLIVSDINQKYQALELFYMDTYTKANLLLNETGAEGQAEAWTNSFDEIISTQRVFSDDSESEANQLTNALNEQMNWLNDQREYYTEEAKVGNEELDDSIQEIIDTTKDLEQELIGQNGLVDSMSKAMSVAGDLAVKFSNQYDSLKNLVEKYDSAARSAHELYNRTVDLIHAQIALNHANNNASAVSWGNGGTTASYFDGSTVTSSDTNGSSYNAGNGPQIGGDPNTSKITRRFSGITYSYDPKTGKYWAYVNYDEFKDNKWVVRKLERLPDPFDTWSKDDSYIKSTSAYKNLAKSLGFRSGGYTGSWNGLDLEENGKLAFLHQKELVLNADDTENMLSAVKLIRQISQTIDLQAAAYNATTSGFSIGQLANSNQTLQQEVTIHAEFPNATDHNEIEEAFNNLINKATQYVNRY